MSIGSFPQKSTRRQQRSKASDIPLTAIAKVVDYQEADEEKHYGGERNHIVHSVRRLKNFLCAIDPDNPLERQRTRQKRRRAKGGRQEVLEARIQSLDVRAQRSRYGPQ